MFEILIELPLFKGASREQIAKIVGSTKFHFLKYLPDEAIFRAGDTCTDIAMVISGSVRIEIDSPDGRFSVSQTVKARDVISPEYLFGRVTTYPGTVRAVGQVSILRISKADYMKILNSDSVFMFNYLNLLATGAQKSLDGVLAVADGELSRRIALCINALTQSRSCNIRLTSQRDLATIFGATPTAMRDTLQDLKNRGWIDYDSNSISVVDRAALLSLLQS